MNSEKGRVAFGANNIFTVTSEGRSYLCRIKGKILREDSRSYNPLAPGDEVEFVPDAHSEREGRILKRLPRRNSLVRWNRKRQTLQTIAANVDLLIIVSSAKNPPFRPRFIDRVLVGAHDIPTLILLNKSDLGIEEAVEERLEDYRRIGFDSMPCSSLTGAGISELEEAVRGKVCVYFGQSGVGKSSLINRLYPGLELEVGDVSMKYDRGRHTTKNARLIEHELGTVIDTPGIRQIELALEGPENLDAYFPDFLPYIGKCSFQPCSHLHEPDCAVREAVEAGGIHPDRYESYVRMYSELEERQNSYA